MTWNGAAYMKAKRDAWLAEGRCGRCGDPNNNGKKTCDPCISTMCAKQSERRHMAKIASGVLPRLQEAVRTGQPAFFSPSEALRLVRHLDA